MKANYRGWKISLLLVAMSGALALEGFVSSIEAAPKVEARGSIGIRLPNGAISINVGGDRYHYYRGAYYRKGKQGYVVVRAPRGAVIRDLPRGYARIIVSGKVYYRYGGVYYRKEPKGYVVVEMPLASKEEVAASRERTSLHSGYESIWAGDRELLFKDGQFFRKTPEGLIWVAAPIGAIAKQLPTDSISVWHEDIEYFDSDGVYFRKTPNGYKVVEAPWKEDHHE